jgi:hypothetical protein
MRTYVRDESGIGVRALSTRAEDRQPHLIHNAAGELPRVELVDALAVCAAIREAEPQRFERAAMRWLARFSLERPEATVAQVHSTNMDPTRTIRMTGTVGRSWC